MSKQTKGSFYAVSRGRTTGVFMTWEECAVQIRAYKGAVFKKFSNAAAAEEFVNGSSTSDASTSFAKPGADRRATNGFGDKGKKRARSSDVEDESGWDVVYCDGACKGNGQPGSVAGVGVWWGINDPRNLAERCPGGQTNNRAELIAILRILETTPITKKPLLIKSDSQYSIDCFKSWLRNWRANNFRTSAGGPVKNAPLIRYIAAHLDARAIKSQQIRLQHVKGHNGEEGNEGADGLANVGATLPALPERDWEVLQRVLEAGSSVETHTAKVVPKEVGEDEVEFVVEISKIKTEDLSPPKKTSTFHPKKIVKTNHAILPVEASSSTTVPKHSAKIYHPPKVVVHADEVDFDTYASERMWDEEPAVMGKKQAKGTDQSKGSIRKPVSEIPKSGVSMAVNEEDIDLDMYADALLSDDELRDLKF